ncbi:hypothetical protein J3A83DRAFT_4412025 [Scleroderma citrinum]
MSSRRRSKGDVRVAAPSCPITEHAPPVEHASHVASSILEAMHAEGARTLDVLMNVLFQRAALPESNTQTKNARVAQPVTIHSSNDQPKQYQLRSKSREHAAETRASFMPTHDIPLDPISESEGDYTSNAVDSLPDGLDGIAKFIRALVGDAEMDEDESESSEDTDVSSSTDDDESDSDLDGSDSDLDESAGDVTRFLQQYGSNVCYTPSISSLKFWDPRMARFSQRNPNILLLIAACPPIRGLIFPDANARASRISSHGQFYPPIPPPEPQFYRLPSGHNMPSPYLRVSDTTDIVSWFSALDHHEQRNKDGIIFTPFGAILKAKGFLRLSQLTSKFIQISDLQAWLNIEAGVAILIVKYAKEDLDALRWGQVVP